MFEAGFTYILSKSLMNTPTIFRKATHLTVGSFLLAD